MTSSRHLTLHFSLFAILLLNLVHAASLPGSVHGAIPRLAVNTSVSSVNASNLGLCSAASPASAPALVDDGCGCYASSGGTTAYYTNYLFADFRSQAPLASAPELPASSLGLETATSSFFTAGFFPDNFVVSAYSEAAAAGTPLENAYSRANVWIGQDTPGTETYITLRSGRAASFQSSAEISTNFELLHASMRMMARVQGGQGAVATMFVYLNGSNESDLEILTREADTVFHATNQPHSTSTVTMSSGTPWTDWVEYKMDWTAEYVQWSVNGAVAATNPADVPLSPAPYLFSAWSNAGPWSGQMAGPGDQAWLDVQWIELAYNTSAAGGSCYGASLCGMYGR